MKMKTKIIVKRKVKEKELPLEYSKELVQEVKEAIKDYKTGKSFKGTVDEIIKNLRYEADKDKKIQ